MFSRLVDLLASSAIILDQECSRLLPLEILLLAQTWPMLGLDGAANGEDKALGRRQRTDKTVVMKKPHNSPWSSLWFFPRQILAASRVVRAPSKTTRTKHTVRTSNHCDYFIRRVHITYCEKKSQNQEVWDKSKKWENLWDSHMFCYVQNVFKSLIFGLGLSRTVLCTVDRFYRCSSTRWATCSTSHTHHHHHKQQQQLQHKNENDHRRTLVCLIKDEFFFHHFHGWYHTTQPTASFYSHFVS